MKKYNDAKSTFVLIDELEKQRVQARKDKNEKLEKELAKTIADYKKQKNPHYGRNGA